MVMPKRIKDPIPAGPFMRWIEDRIAYHNRNIGLGRHTDSTQRVCKELGWDRARSDSGPRKLYRYRYGITESRTGQCRAKGIKGTSVIVPRPMYPRAEVEDALHHAGVPLEDVYSPEMYPALYEDIPLEPECWCPSCRDSCTPIKGVCPWCEWRVSAGHLRERMA